MVQKKNAIAKQAAFRCYASLGANDEDIRKRIIELEFLMDEVLAGLADNCPDVRKIIKFYVLKINLIIIILIQIIDYSYR